MCLTTKYYGTRKEVKELKPLIAKKDIKVYKVISNDNRSPFYHFLYEKGFHYVEDKFKGNVEGSKQRWRLIVNNGLHAKLSLKEARNLRDSKFNCKVVTMYVPKGSKYYIGRNDDIASDNLVWY